MANTPNVVLPLVDQDKLLFSQARPNEPNVLRMGTLADLVDWLPPIISLSRRSIFVTVTQQMIDDEQLDIGVSQADGSQVQIIPVGGPVQVPNVDYQVNGSIISWHQMGLEMVIEKDQILNITYLG